MSNVKVEKRDQSIFLEWIKQNGAVEGTISPHTRNTFEGQEELFNAPFVNTLCPLAFRLDGFFQFLRRKFDHSDEYLKSLKSNTGLDSLPSWNSQSYVR
jgi:hypothetical protein